MLKSHEALSREQMNQWYLCAKEFLPNGVIASVQTTDNHGNLRSATMVHREVGGENEYYIPLTRDLVDREAETVVREFASSCGDLDFDIEVSSAQSDLLGNNRSVDVDNDRFLDLCSDWAKKQHETWLKDRLDSGWRYGPTMSLKNKTHPLCRSWHDLPDNFKKVDTSQPQALLDLLNDQGYSVISRAELDGIMKLLKGSL